MMNYGIWNYGLWYCTVSSRMCWYIGWCGIYVRPEDNGLIWEKGRYRAILSVHDDI